MRKEPIETSYQKLYNSDIKDIERNLNKFILAKRQDADNRRKNIKATNK